MHKFAVHDEMRYRPVIIEAADTVAAVEIYRRKYASITAKWIYVDLIA